MTENTLTKKEIGYMKRTLQKVNDYNKKYHNNKPYDIIDVIQNSLHNCDTKTYRATAEYVAAMITEFCPDRLSVLETWRGHRSKNPYEDHYEWWNDETEFIENLRADPKSALKEVKKKGGKLE